jgi:LacI family transcriptional regulator
MASEAVDSLNNSVQEIERKADAKTRKLIDLVTSRILDGLLIDKSRFGNRQIALLEEAEVPFVLVNGRVPYEKLDVHRKACWVSIDHVHGGRVATDYLLRCGHRRIAIITLPISKYPVDYAPNMYCFPKEGFISSIEKAGLNVCPEFTIEGSVSDREKLFANLDTLMSLSNRPTAIFVADDYLAVLTMTYLASKGFRLPEDVSIVGYGNMPVCSAVVPTLTTVHVPWAKMGQAGFEMLVGLLQETKEISVERSIHVNILEPALVEGGSAVMIR